MVAESQIGPPRYVGSSQWHLGRAAASNLLEAVVEKGQQRVRDEGFRSHLVPHARGQAQCSEYTAIMDHTDQHSINKEDFESYRTGIASSDSRMFPPTDQGPVVTIVAIS